MTGYFLSMNYLVSLEENLLQQWVEHGGMDLRVVVVGTIMVSYFRVGEDNF